MYNVPHFKTADQEEIMAFIQAHPFIILCGCDAVGKPVATHVPVLIEERQDKLFLLAHVMRKQEHTKAFEQNPEVLVIFSGAHTYVSASWYQDKQTAATWNYQAVHAKGVLHFLDDAGLHALLTRLTETFENNPESPSLVQHMDEHYVISLMKAIIAFEIEVTDIQHVFKLSQNKDEKTYNSVTEHLNNGDVDAKIISEKMKERKHKVFPS